MAFGRFNSYEPMGNGAFRFQTNDGNQFSAVGPEAQRMAQAIDASRGMGQMAMGGGMRPSLMSGGAVSPDQRAPESRLDAGGGLYGGAPMQPVEPPAPAAAPPSPVTEKEQPPAEEKDELTPHTTDASGRQIYKTSSGKYLKYIPGSAGSKGGWAEVSKSVHGGFDRDADYEEAVADASIDQKLAVQSQADAEEQEAMGMVDVLSQQQEAIRENIAEESQRQAEIGKRVDDYRVRHEKMQKEYESSKVDPNRAHRGFSDRMALALGAMGAAINNGPNFAQEVISRRIDNDIRAQEQEISKKGKAADNMLSRLTSELGSADLARSSLKIMQMQEMRNAGEIVVQKARGPKAQAAAQAAMAGIDENIAKEQEAYRLKSLGEATRQFQNRPGTRGSAGGFATVSLDEAGKLQKLDKEESGGDDKLKTIDATIETGQKMLSNYADDEVPQMPENRNVLSRAASAVNDWAFGAGESVRDMEPRERQMVQDAAMIDTAIAHGVSQIGGQGALAGQERIDVDKGTAPGATMGERKRALMIIQAKREAMKK